MPVSVVMLADVIVAFVRTMLVRLTLSIVALVALSVVIVAEVELNCVITPLEAVIEPDAERFPDVEILPTAVIAPDASKLLTALEPAVNFVNCALTALSPVSDAEP